MIKDKPLVLRNPSFGLLWLGQIFSQGGTRMFQIAILWWVVSHYQQVGLTMGIFMVLCALPAIVFVKPIGLLVDRFSTQKVLIYSEILAALVCLSLWFLVGQEFFVYGAILLFGTFLATIQGIVDPALNKAIPQLVDDRDLETGVAFVSSTLSLANFGGAICGAVLIENLGLQGAILVNLFSYLLSATFCGLARFRTMTLPESASQEVAFSLKDHHSLFKVLLGFGFVNFFGTPTLLVLPVYTKSLLSEGASTLALLEAFLWVGLVVGAFLGKLVDIKEQTFKIGGLSLINFGLMLLIPGLIVNAYVVMVALFFAGVGLGLNNVKFLTLFQQVVEDRFKGQFFARLGAVISFSFPVSFLFFGVLLDLLPTTTICLIQGFGVMGVALWYLVNGAIENQLRRGVANL